MFISCSCDEKARRLYLYTLIFMMSYGCYILLLAVYFKISVNLVFYVNSSSRTLVIIPYFIIKVLFKNNDNILHKEKLRIKNTIRDYIIFFLIIINQWFFCLFILVSFDVHLSTQGILILLLSLYIKITHKTKIERHKMCSFIILIIFFLLYDILSCIISNKIISFKIIMLQIVYILLYTVILIYRKFLMEEKHMSPYVVCSIFGVVDLFFLIILGIMAYNYKNFLYINNKPVDLPKFDDIIEEPFLIIKFIPFIICLIIFYITYYLLIDELTLIHPVILETITTFLEKSVIILLGDIKNKGFYIVFFLISFFFLVIILFIFIEIIELKCCGLNQNTRRELLKREQIESLDILNSMNNEYNFRVPINDQYEIELINGQEK